MNDLATEIQTVNRLHWTEDYNDSVLVRDSLLRMRLARRVTPEIKTALEAGMVCMGTSGPCEKYAFELCA